MDTPTDTDHLGQGGGSSDSDVAGPALHKALGVVGMLDLVGGRGGGWGQSDSEYSPDVSETEIRKRATTHSMRAS